MDKHATEPSTIVLKKKRPESARPRRPVSVKPEDDIHTIEKPKLDISLRIAEARILKGYKTRQDLAKALNINVDIINCIESRKNKEKYSKEVLNKIRQHLQIKSI